MDIDDFRTIMDTAGVDVWTLIDTAMEAASIDYGTLLKQRRDGIVERLFALTSAPNLHRHGRSNGENMVRVVNESRSGLKESSPSTPHSMDGDDGLDPYGGLFDDEQKKILDIKEQLEIPHQSEDGLVDLLQSLADMDITFQALKETDIGRHVNQLRKHSSNTVRKLVKHLVRKWKDIVDEWVRVNRPGEQNTATLIADEDESPQWKIPRNGLHQVPDFAYSPNPHNGSSGSDRNNSEPEPKPKPKPKAVQQREVPRKSVQSVPASSAPQNRQCQEKESNFDSERLDSARRRLQANYKEAENAKKQRTIQVMSIHEIPKPKNTFYAKNKAGMGSGGGSHGRNW